MTAITCSNEDRAYRMARYDHAMLLRCEGLPYHEIAVHFGVSTNRARSLTARGAVEWYRGMKRAKLWRVN